MNEEMSDLFKFRMGRGSSIGKDSIDIPNAKRGISLKLYLFMFVIVAAIMAFIFLT